MGRKLEKKLKSESEIDGKASMVAISPEGDKVTQKGFRRGPELTWRSIISGEAEMGQQLRSSVGATGGGDSEGEALVSGCAGALYRPSSSDRSAHRIGVPERSPTFHPVSEKPLSTLHR